MKIKTSSHHCQNILLAVIKPSPHFFRCRVFRPPLMLHPLYNSVVRWGIFHCLLSPFTLHGAHSLDVGGKRRHAMCVRLGWVQFRMDLATTSLKSLPSSVLSLIHPLICLNISPVLLRDFQFPQFDSHKLLRLSVEHLGSVLLS